MLGAAGASGSQPADSLTASYSESTDSNSDAPVAGSFVGTADPHPASDAAAAAAESAAVVLALFMLAPMVSVYPHCTLRSTVRDRNATR